MGEIFLRTRSIIKISASISNLQELEVVSHFCDTSGGSNKLNCVLWSCKIKLGILGFSWYNTKS